MAVPAHHTSSRAAGPRGALGGFTIIEICVALAIAAVLLRVALPSLRDMMQGNRVLAEVNSLAGDLQFARSEAIKQGIPVSLCASSNGTSCLGTTAWHSGWIVFPDAAGTGAPATGVTPLRVRSAFLGGDTLVADNNVRWLTYSRDGFATNLPATTVTLTLHTNPARTTLTRCLALNRLGRQQVQTAGSGSCA